MKNHRWQVYVANDDVIVDKSQCRSSASACRLSLDYGVKFNQENGIKG